MDDIRGIGTTYGVGTTYKGVVTVNDVVVAHSWHYLEENATVLIETAAKK